MDLEFVRIINIPSHEDERGVLSSIEQNIDVPFDIKRIFYIYNIKAIRGSHALKDTNELLIAVAGSFVVSVTDKNNTKNYLLSKPSEALFVPSLIFMEITQFSKDAVCLVLADRNHDLKQYLKTKEEYYQYIENIKLK